jgi:hypothetical protein
MSVHQPLALADSALPPVVQVAGIPSELPTAADPSELDAIAAAQVTVPADELDRLAGSVPVDSDMPVVARVAIGTASDLFLVMVYSAGDTTREKLYDVVRATGLATELANGTATLTSGTIVGDGVSAATGWTTQSHLASAAYPCTGCVLAGTAAGVVAGAVVCTAGGFLTLLVCGAAAVVVGAATQQVCQTLACAGSPPPGMHFVAGSCSYYYCDTRIDVENAGRQVISIGSTVYWYYAQNTCATVNGGCYPEWGESGNYPISAAIDLGNGTQQYALRFTSGVPDWTTCAVREQISTTVQWSDYDFRTTGFIQGGKPANVTCPGFTVLT